MTERLRPVEPPYDASTAELLRKWMPPGVDVDPLRLFRTFAIHPELASRMRPLGAALLGHPTIEPREREIVIHRTTALCGAEYEWGVHAVVYGTPLGLSEEQLEATVRGDAGSPAWTSARDRLLIRLCDELHSSATVTDDLWAELEAEWSQSQLMELLVLAGWYRTIAYVINGGRVQPEEWAARFPPPDG